jgi:cytochrome c oxidase subunit 1
VSFPRLNAFAYWLYAFGGTLAVAGFITPGGAADFGWFAYRRCQTCRTRRRRRDMWIVGLVISGLGTILGAVNMITTILTLRAPGMTMFRMPIFTWNIMVTSLLVSWSSRSWPRPCSRCGRPASRRARLRPGHRRGAAVAAPVLVLRPSRGLHRGAAVLRHHLRDHPGVQPQADLRLQGPGRATIAIAALSMSVWAHHMFATGQVLLPFFSFLSFLIAVPTGHEVLQLDRHHVAGPDHVRDADAVRDRASWTFLFGGLSACCWLAARSTSTSPTRTSWWRHFHYVLFGTIVFAVYAGIYFWFPKMTGRMMDERWGKVHFWLTIIGFNVTFLVQHWLGAEGMPAATTTTCPRTAGPR